MVYSALNGTLISQGFIFLGLRNHYGRMVKNVWKSKVDDYEETVSPGHKVVALINLTVTVTTFRRPHKLKPDLIPVWRGEMARKSHQ